MATACERDSEMQRATTDVGSDGGQESADSRRDPANSETSNAAIHCFQGICSLGACTSPVQKDTCVGCGLLGGMQRDSDVSIGMPESTQSLCLLQNSNGQPSTENRPVLNPSLSSSTVAINFGASLASADVLSITSDYYAYLEAVKQLVVKNNVTVRTLQHCLKYTSCLKKPGVHPLFSQSSAMSKAENPDQLFAAVEQLSSWYNHSLVTHLATSLLGEEGTTLADKYSTTLSGHCATMLLLLPQFSSGCWCSDDFEAVLVDIERTIQSCSLADTIRVHETLADIFEMNSSVVFLERITQGKLSGSTLTFWVPKSVTSQAASAALNNTSAMSGEGITCIRTKYETISSGPSKDQVSSNGRPHSRGVAESGYETLYLSSSSPDVPPNRTASRSHESLVDSGTEEELDEVFITVLSPDAADRYADHQYMLQQYSDDSSAVEWSADNYSDRSNMVCGHIHITTPPSACSDDGEKEGGESPSLVDGSQQGEQDRPESAPPQIFDKQEEQAAINELLQVNPLMLPMDASMQESMNLMCSAGMQVQQRRKNNLGKTVSSVSEESLYVAMSSAPISLPENTPPETVTSLPKTTPPETVTMSHSQQTRKPLYRFSYCIVRCHPSSFVKRVLRRASQKWPANLQMVTITGYEGSIAEGMLTVSRAQRVTALYTEGRNIIATTTSGEVGSIPYSICRLSKSHYGRTSKSAVLDTTQFYSISTMCIHKISSFTANEVYPGETVDIDFIIIKSHAAVDKDEMDVSVGDYIRMLYCDDSWVYGASRNHQAGFIPRDNCRLVKKSDEMLRHCHWVKQSFRFQADFIFDLTKPPPPHLLQNLYLPNEDRGKSLMLAHSYTPPRSGYTIQRGVPLKIIYTEDRHFFYVAMSNGMSFWIPAPYCQSFSLKRHRSSIISRSNEDISTPEVPLLPCLSRQRSSSTTVGSSKHKKKVSFAPSVDDKLIHGSNPELSSALSSSKRKSSGFRSMIPARRTRSNDSLQVFMLLNEESPTNLCATGCNFFCF